MVKLKVSYENEQDKLRIIDCIAKGSKIIEIKPGKKKGQYSRLYITVY